MDKRKSVLESEEHTSLGTISHYSITLRRKALREHGMIFQRGNPLDYERWAADPGMQSWDYAHCLPYFKRMETCLAGADAWLVVTPAQHMRAVLARAPHEGKTLILCSKGIEQTTGKLLNQVTRGNYMVTRIEAIDPTSRTTWRYRSRLDPK